MTISEACERVLKDLGGRAHLSEIYPRVLKLVTLTGATPKNSIRTEMKNHPLLFRHSPNKPRGWWELTSYQEEVAALQKEIIELKESLKQALLIPKEADFLNKFLPALMDFNMFDRKATIPIRHTLKSLGYEDEAAVLDAWINEKDKELKEALLKLAEKAVISLNVEGDYVLTKNVENEIDKVEDGGVGVNTNKEK